jgi:3-oxoacyl-[acyl-carrier protein] reductase
MRLNNRVAIVTGAARGIGQAYCLALAREGANIVAADILSCGETVAKVQQAGGEALGVTADVANALSSQAMAAQTLQRFGRIDILVNNAAVYGGLTLTPFEKISEAEWDPGHEAAGLRQDYQHLIGHHLDGGSVALALCGVERRSLRAHPGAGA